jgi:hypothetical protein
MQEVGDARVYKIFWNVGGYKESSITCMCLFLQIIPIE